MGRRQSDDEIIKIIKMVTLSSISKHNFVFSSDLTQNFLSIFHWKPSENLTMKLRSDIYCQVTTEVRSFRFDFFLCFVYFQEWNPCLADAIRAEPAPVPKVFNFFALTAYQTSYLYKRSNLCPKLTYGRVKKIAEDSGK